MMHEGDESAPAGQTLGWRRRLLGIGNDARMAWQAFHWRSEDTLALVVVAIVLLVLVMVLLHT